MFEFTLENLVTNEVVKFDSLTDVVDYLSEHHTAEEVEEILNDDLYYYSFKIKLLG